MRRKPGQASVEEHPKGSGKFRVRARVRGRLETIASGLPEPEAFEVADAYTVVRNESVLRQGLTLAQFGTGFLDRRERSGIRGIENDRGVWRRYIAGDPIGGLPIATLERRDVLEWLDRWARLGPQTRRNARNLLSVALQEAVDRGLAQFNVARDVRIRGRGKDSLDGILTPDEQKRLLAAIPLEHRPLVVFALMTGLRQAEQWWLAPDDLGDGYITVRRSRGGKPPKNGRERTVHLLGPAARALELRPASKAWAWPGTRGGRRPEGKAPKAWHRWVAKAKIGRRIRWKDLRHTCATSLLAGWWGGRKWMLDEVCTHLGHSSVTVTERYARKLADTHRLAVAATQFPESSPLMLPGIERSAENKQSHLRDLNSRPTVYENQGNSKGFVRLLGGVFPRGNVEALPGPWALFLAAERLLGVSAVHLVTVTRRRKESRGRRGNSA